MTDIPLKQGLYDPQNEHDACGVGLVIDIQGNKSHEIVETGLHVLENMRHRGAEGADHKSGDGAGMMVQIPHEFILLQGIPVPEKGRYGTGLVFLPKDPPLGAECLNVIRTVVHEERLSLMHVRDVPVCSDILGETALETEPDIKQIFVTDPRGLGDLPGRLFTIRKKIESEISRKYPDNPKCCYVVSLSSTNLVYKGMLSSQQLRYYFTDLQNPYFTSGIALVHSRFSTNTFPTWDLAQPFRLIGHNGEINTIQGNRAWMQARESVLHPRNLGASSVSPIIQPGMSDSASLDNAIEFFVMSGMSLPHALAMLVPESYNDRNRIPESLKGFYEYHSIWMEPWDGPAAILFSDGRYAGGMLDRNGLRPARYLITTDNTMVIASETGVTDFPASQIREKGRLRPGKMLMVDTKEGRIMFDEEIKASLAGGHPYREWLKKNRIVVDQVTSGRKVSWKRDNYLPLLKTFGYTKEEIERIIKPMACDASEPLYSMGSGTPLAVLSSQPQRLFNYFRQKFAQVTNPPIDPLREELVMSLAAYIGAVDGNALIPSPEMCKVVKLTSPVVTNRAIDILRNLRYKGFRTHDLDMIYNAHAGGKGLEEGILDICRQAETAVDNGCNYIILTDRKVDSERAPIPSLMALSAVHHYLIKKRKRSQIALIVETGEAREIMHIALLIGYGASAVNPYMAFAVLGQLVEAGELQLDWATAEKNYVKAIDKGMLKVMSKMGISTVRSYRGAKLFDAVGLSSAFTEKYFEGTCSPIGGAGIEEIAAEAAAAHREAFSRPEEEPANTGIYSYRRGGEKHAWTPEAVKALQQAARTGDYEKYREFESIVNGGPAAFIRDLVELPHSPIDLKEVEPEESILKRFVSGAMSFGSISGHAHRAVSMAMNAVGGRSNTGEGGEPEAVTDRQEGISSRNAIKQVASGRFGVTARYLSDADEIQIKVAQGAKPGEGGQLPGYKVDEMIARTRHSLPGISLISPPPHHDIYSIEDLAQLIFDLKNVNPKARISVKLVSESGVGTVAAGVAKAKADIILISGSEGGTGASPISSVRYAGMPLETGLAEAQQTLVLNNLRGGVILQADGQFKTGRDVVVSAMLGAEEFGFATSLMVVLGCIVDRRCHLNTCPVGIATQDNELCKKYKGEYSHIVNYLRFVAKDVREHLASMGFRSLDEIVGRADLLTQKKIPAPKGRTGQAKTVCDPLTLRAAKISGIDLSALLYLPGGSGGNDVKKAGTDINHMPVALDRSIAAMAAPALEKGLPVVLDFKIGNTDRSVGAYLSGQITRKTAGKGLPEDTLRVTFNGSAGQSFGAFLAPGITFTLHGDANDYLAKGISGGKVILTPPEGTLFEPEKNIIAGNTILYGATGGEVYIDGQVGERFCVRNSGALAVAEGAGDHCCEYMTGGVAVILGPTGRNFAAGMSGGVAYVWDPAREFDFYCNMETVEIELLEESGDEKRLHGIVSSHYYHTGSPLAKRMLDDWDIYSTQFLRIIPIEYKAILDIRR
ncbi:MAG: glutamate synthase large subunit [Rikenellaceae bacterium]|nr:glutamate synthase large subunit [Rikenellaceae bacterium]